ncbi:hypothetical protein H1Q63_19650 [Desmonostoc muscorum CCALA 125]|nr:hypothetical protein [Desmonostoc muscorum CCALA 125]
MLLAVAGRLARAELGVKSYSPHLPISPSPSSPSSPHSPLTPNYGID